MREFRAGDGRMWSARSDADSDTRGSLLARVGWEIILFEPHVAGGDQRFAHRPAGWLPAATDEELVAALDDAESIRSRWGVPHA